MVGRFTTDPKLARFGIQDVMKYIPNPFPVSARLFLDDGDTAKRGPLLPDILTKDRVLLLDSTVSTSLVATCELYGESKGTGTAGNGTGTVQNRTGTAENGTGMEGKSGGTVVEIPVSQDILVSFLSKNSQGSTSNSLTTLHARTVALWKSLLSPAGSDKVMSRLGCLGEDSVQHKLFTMVHRSRERECQAIKAPPQLHKDLSAMDKSTGDAQTYQPLLSDTEIKSQYMAVMSSLTGSSDYEDADSDAMEEDDPFISDRDIKVYVGLQFDWSSSSK